MDSLHNFVSKLDDIVEEYNALLNVNQDREFLIRSIELIEKKYKERIANMEQKLRIAKVKWQYENKLRKKAEEEKNELTETLKMLTNKLDNSNSVHTNSTNSDNNFVTISSEDSFKETGVINWRRHSSNPSIVNIGKPKISSNLKCTVRSKKSPDLSYLGVTRLEEKSCDKKLLHSTAITEKPPEQFSVSSISKTPEVPRRCEKKLFETFILTPKRDRDSNSRFMRNIISYDKVTESNLDNTVHSISKFAPLVPPMIPALVIHCVNEVEKRGLREIGIYRMAGIQEDLEILQEKFNRDHLDLSEVSVHSVAAFLKNFLLDNHLIPKPFHPSFVKTNTGNENDRLFYGISLLPQANRDTLAYIVVHLRRVIASAACKMNADKISAVFNCIIFGIEENEKENLISVKELLQLPGKYWQSFIIEPPLADTPSKLRNSPLTEQLVRRKKYFTPNRTKKRFFLSPLEQGLDEIRTKLSILNCFFDDIEELLNFDNGIHRTHLFKIILKEMKVVMGNVDSDLSILLSVDNSSSDSGYVTKPLLSVKTSSKIDISSQDDSKTCEFSKVSTKPKGTKNEACLMEFLKKQSGNTTLKTKNIIQSNLKRFFASHKIDSRNNVKRIKLETATQVTSVESTLQKIQPIVEEITRVASRPVIYDVVQHEANKDQKKCQQMKLNAIKIEQEMCKGTSEGSTGTKKSKEETTVVQVSSQINSENISASQVRYVELELQNPGRPVLPAEPPLWQWNPDVPSAKADFIFWDETNRVVVYCCRTCFKAFLYGAVRYNHEKKIDPDSRKAHFPYYTSPFYLRQKYRKSRY